jgi:hypothetical protein
MLLEASLQIITVKKKASHLMIKGWPDHQSLGGNLTQFAIVLLSNYAKIRNKVKRLCILLAISRLFIYYYYYIIMN